MVEWLLRTLSRLFFIHKLRLKIVPILEFLLGPDVKVMAMAMAMDLQESHLENPQGVY